MIDPAKFAELVKRWEGEMPRHSSKIKDYLACPACREIVALGPEVVPLILEWLQDHPNHLRLLWPSVLREITGEDVVQPKNRGYLARMCNDWLNWGKQRT